MFTSDFAEYLQEKGFLKSVVQEDAEVLHISTPSYILFTQPVMALLRAAYLPDEEIGGLLWARPTKRTADVYYEIDTVSFIRNAIDDTSRTDGRTKKNAYLVDTREYRAAYQECVAAKCIPFSFHTHPTHGDSSYEELQRTMNNWETSEQDIRASAQYEWASDGIRVHLPRVLIVGHDSLPGNFLIGIYGGMVAPTSLEPSKNVVMRQNMDSILTSLLNVKLTPGQKILAGTGVACLLALAIKYRKSSGPIIMSLLILAPAFLNDTDWIENPPYYCKTSANEGKIYIPALIEEDA